MTSQDIIVLLQAGYTKEEISAMDAPDAAESLQPDIQAPQPETMGLSQPATPAPENAIPTQELLEAIQTLTAAVQHNNKINTPQPTAIVPDDVQTQADEILTKFCNT